MPLGGNARYLLEMLMRDSGDPEGGIGWLAAGDTVSVGALAHPLD